MVAVTHNLLIQLVDFLLFIILISGVRKGYKAFFKQERPLNNAMLNLRANVYFSQWRLNNKSPAHFFFGGAKSSSEESMISTSSSDSWGRLYYSYSECELVGLVLYIIMCKTEPWNWAVTAQFHGSVLRTDLTQNSAKWVLKSKTPRKQFCLRCTFPRRARRHFIIEKHKCAS